MPAEHFPDRDCNDLAAVVAEQARNRPPRDVVPRRPATDRLPAGPQDVTFAEVTTDVDGVPTGVAVHTTNAWVAKPVTPETIARGGN